MATTARRIGERGDGCAVCKGWRAISRNDARGGGSRVRETLRLWIANCAHCGRETGRGPKATGLSHVWFERRKK